MEVGLVRKVDIDREMQQSYLDFAMSVIVARALPDARDGLKPVQRRILYAMYDMGLRPELSYKKSARIVGEVLGKYHPHGDMAVYEAMARLAQDFSMRYPLVDGQGNFGSVDGDPPAAMRYTEARLKPFAIDMLSQIDRNTVNFTANFDESLTEPDVLPAALPNLLVNGSTGIAVGMATNIPPHNLTEVIDALAYMLEQWDRLDDINISDLMRYIKGPDLPTGGVILQDPNNDLMTTYATGKGRFLVRGQVHTEDTGRGRSRLIITELPYMTNKASLIERIAELVREGHLEGISDLRDESDRQGMRIVIELSKTGDPEEVLRELYRRTPLESTLGITLLALVDGEPRLLTLKQALRVYLDHRLVVVKRRSEFDLSKARQRAHFLEGLRIAIANLDEVIKIIRAAPDVETARERLIKRFKLSEIQTQAILDMPLRRLAALERRKIDEEYKEILKAIKDLELLLRSPRKMREVVETELMQMREAYGDKRRTRIVSLKEGETARTMLMTTDLTPAEEAWVGISADGLISRAASDEASRAGGRQTARWLLRANTHHTLYLVSETGQCAAVAVHALPEADQLAEGVPLNKASALPEGERLAGIFSTPPRNGNPHADHFILTVSEQGLVKKSAVADLPGPSSQSFTLTKVNAGDRLVSAMLTAGSAEVLIATARGMAIRFSENEVRPMGLVAAGVNGIKLAAGDTVAGAERFDSGGDILLLAANGSGWRIPATEFPLQGRYGQGVTACKPVNTRLVGLLAGKPARTAVALLDKAAGQPVKIGDLSAGKRASGGKTLLAVKPGDQVTALASSVDCLFFWDPAAAPQEKKTRAPRKPAGGGELSLDAPAVQAELPLITGSAAKAPVKAARTRKPAVAEKPAPAKAVASGKKAVPAKKPAAKKTTPAKKTATAKKPEPVGAKKAAPPKGAAAPAKKAATAAIGKPTVKKDVAVSAKKAPSAAKKPVTPTEKSATAAAKPPAKLKPGAAKAAPTAKAEIPAPARARKTAVKVEPQPVPAPARGKAKPVAAPPEIGLVGQVRTSGKVVEVNSGRVKTTRAKKTEESAPPASTTPARSTRKKPAEKPAEAPKKTPVKPKSGKP